MNRKYGAVKSGTFQSTPVTLEFVEQKESREKSIAAGRKTRLIRYFLVIDSRSSETSVNCENIESIEENDKKMMVIIYNLPDGKDKDGKVKMARKEDKFDCCENQLFMKTFKTIQKQIAESPSAST